MTLRSTSLPTAVWKRVLFTGLLTIAERIQVSHKDWIAPPSRPTMTILTLIDPRFSVGYNPRSTPLSLRSGPIKFVSSPNRAPRPYSVSGSTPHCRTAPDAPACVGRGVPGVVHGWVGPGGYWRGTIPGYYPDTLQYPYLTYSLG